MREEPKRKVKRLINFLQNPDQIAVIYWNLAAQLRGETGRNFSTTVLKT